MPVGYVVWALRVFFWGLRELSRKLSRKEFYVGFTLDGSYQTLPPPKGPFWRRWFSPPPSNLDGLKRDLSRIAGDRRVKGVVFRLGPLEVNQVQVQHLRGFMKELRERGKDVVVWASGYNTLTYYLASAASRILIQPGGIVGPLGIVQSFVFLKDALARWGIEADFVQISPYKTAADTLTRREMSPEMREMVNWLLDSLYDDLLEGVSSDRGIPKERVAELFDSSPLTAEEAREAGLVDGIAEEEKLPELLGGKVIPWPRAKRRVARPRPPRPGRYVALIRISGQIVDGKSRRPPAGPRIPFLFSEREGDLTVVAKARAAARDKRARAVVLYIDSPGGSGTASEAMNAALKELAGKKPLVVAMDSVAASGGYYVASPGKVIFAQPATITGSIGVLAGKIVNAGLLEKLRANRELIYRGKHALMFSSARPFSDEERELMWKVIERFYRLFLKRVSEGRKLPEERVDEVGKGKVWTGKQALEHGLVDRLGGFWDALDEARRLGKLPPDSPWKEVPEPKGPSAPLGEPKSLLEYALESLELLSHAGGLALCPLLPAESLRFRGKV